jgi:predicted helicase
MSQHLIGLYLNELADLRRVSGRTNESIVREAFKTLLKNWGRSKDLILVPEYPFETPRRERRVVDGALVPSELRVPYGYWEAKDEEDDLDAEIERKFRRGYPQDNIVFEDSRHAVLFQNRREITRCAVDDPAQLSRLLELFFSYDRPEIADFRKAVAQFKTDLPAVLEALRAMIESAEAANPQFRLASLTFLRHAQETINPSVTAADVREMLIQHILTEEIFSHVFDNSDFHRQNNIARELYRLAETFFTGAVRRQILERLRAYYAAIRSAAALVSSHHEKQNFLKVVYENFYKVYNPKAADRLGGVYTPNEIVRFMIEGADWLCQRYFGKQLIDRDVEILDPAAGTGTFIAELIEHFRGQPAKLKYKYKEELHANEVAILPYYVANLNIEATYAALTGEYEEYPNLCFVDTLDNVAGLRTHRAGSGHFGDLLGALSDENVARIRRQNERKISVIIGNPPYNANQLNENENNKNRQYPTIDRRIKETYITASTAQKTKVYDMYARFFRWASDRVEENGIIAFVTNRSFTESRTFDGFRRIISDEFSDIYVIDLGGDVRVDPRLSGTRHNVFGIQTGIAISFMVKRIKAQECRIQYLRRPQLETAEEKMSFLSSNPLSTISLDRIEPDQANQWLNISCNNFDEFISTGTKITKIAKNRSQERAIFKLYTLGVVTNRDDWVYDSDRDSLRAKIKCFIETYNAYLNRLGGQGRKKDVSSELGPEIKWTRAVKWDLGDGVRYTFSENKIVRANYRPFVVQWLYRDDHLNEMQNQTSQVFDDGRIRNPAITIMGDSSVNRISHWLLI